MLLAFDTASPTVTVALHDGTDAVGELASEQSMKHGEQLMPLIEEVVRRSGLAARDLTAIAVGVGPGPFTGLRVGLVTARTLGHALEVPVYGACSLDVLAVEAVARHTVDGPFAVATDARRKEVYLATYDGDGHRVDGPAVVRPAEATTRGPVVGEGAEIYADHFPGARGPLRPSAGWLARAVADELVELSDPEPLYLRRPDAEIPRAPKPVS
ncbi:tRNA threonylcarbamoyl adenosine modification protein YeaZ [Nocardioides thalensis]|uniref:tRNA threonylcarbamoyl adenosine modification protein YeaZ n=1 Tax=Nocardioides thalensis TaxID=1914755 RepID=A0A853C4J1_9ACTN|nr:tRNA threonylcarbamoyl adenosine modification protein YeaZ [Nocardioides thalensis]